MFADFPSARLYVRLSVRPSVRLSAFGIYNLQLATNLLMKAFLIPAEFFGSRHQLHL